MMLLELMIMTNNIDFSHFLFTFIISIQTILFQTLSIPSIPSHLSFYTYFFKSSDFLYFNFSHPSHFLFHNHNPHLLFEFNKIWWAMVIQNLVLITFKTFKKTE